MKRWLISFFGDNYLLFFHQDCGYIDNISFCGVRIDNMSSNNVILRFDNVTFKFGEHKEILNEASFSVREGLKMTIMGQNGAGKSTILKMITEELKPQEGRISKDSHATIAIAKQVLDRSELDLTTREYFALPFGDDVPFNLDKRIKDALETVNLTNWDMDRKLAAYSGGQKARLLLAHALIQEPDILLLDEPTNNLDQDGIEYLTGFLIMYDKTCLVISHDSVFLNSFTDGVLYLDVHTHQVEQYSGDYYTVVDEIDARRERELKQNARMNKQIKDQKDKINFFANKGGKMRKLASKLRDQVADAEDNVVEVRQEDKTIREFTIPVQDELSGELISLSVVPLMKGGEVVHIKSSIELRKGDHIQLHGPNGIGKTTLLNNIADKNVPHMNFDPTLKLGYYSQDFHNLDFDSTVRDSLVRAMGEDPTVVLNPTKEHKMRSTAAGFLITKEIISSRIGDLSEGQKGLVAFTHLVLQEPGVLILDEPTNHINFRHIPIIAQALDQYEGAMILVSHVQDFVEQIRIDKVIDLERL